MKLEDMILVSTDDHLIEPADMFKHHTPEKYKGRYPMKKRRDDGVDVWVIEDREVSNSAMNAVAGRPPHELGFEPQRWEQVRKGCYDADARIDDMNANGQLGALCFSTWPGFAGRIMREGKDKDLMRAIIQSYNDWHYEDWYSKHPTRFIPLALLPTWSPEWCADEIARVKKKGFNTVSFIANPVMAGLEHIHGGHWDPLWQAACDHDVSICLHIGDTTAGMAASPHSPYDVWATGMGVSLFSVASEITWSPILRKFANLKFVLSEGGAGWVPALLERMDFVFKHHHHWTNQDFGGRLPSDVFKEHFYTCILDDQVAIENRKRIGVDTMTWECDYPHSDSLWPRGPEVLWKSFAGGDVTDEEINKITHLNAMKLFQWDPFKTVNRKDCTVGALRAKAKHVDLGYVFDHDAAPLTLPPTDKPRKVQNMETYMKNTSNMAVKSSMGQRQ